MGTALLTVFARSDTIMSSIEPLISLKFKTVSARSISSPVEINIAASNISRCARNTAFFRLGFSSLYEVAARNIAFNDCGISEPMTMIFLNIIENLPREGPAHQIQRKGFERATPDANVSTFSGNISKLQNRQRNNEDHRHYTITV